MKARGLVPRSAEHVKVLADGDLGHALTVRAHKFSATAKEKLAAAKGTAEEIAPKPAATDKGAKS